MDSSLHIGTWNINPNFQYFFFLPFFFFTKLFSVASLLNEGWNSTAWDFSLRSLILLALRLPQWERTLLIRCACAKSIYFLDILCGKSFPSTMLDAQSSDFVVKLNVKSFLNVIEIINRVRPSIFQRFPRQFSWKNSRFNRILKFCLSLQEFLLFKSLQIFSST